MIGRPVLLINLLAKRYNLVPVIFCGRTAFLTTLGRCAALLADDCSKKRKTLHGSHAARNCAQTSASEGGYLIGYSLVGCIDGTRRIHGPDLDCGILR